MPEQNRWTLRDIQIDAVERLKAAIPVYEQLDHPFLIKLKDYFVLRDGYAAVFEWADGECLHSRLRNG